MRVETAELSQLNAFAAELGANIMLVQGPGGNVSLKDESHLWIKASGTWLARARLENIMIRLALPAARAILSSGLEDLSASVIDRATSKPSIETSLHAFMPHRFVVHLHSVNVLYWAVQENGRALMSRRMRGLKWIWLDYVRPGLPLTAALSDVFSTEEKIDIVILGNHGIVLGAEAISQMREKVCEVEARLSPPTAARLRGPRIARPPLTIESTDASREPRNGLVHSIAFSPVALKLVDRVLYPDHAIFLGQRIPVLSAHDQLALNAILSQPPFCAVIPGVGVILGPKCSKAAEAMLECFALLTLLLSDAEHLRYLEQDEISELLTWDAEKFRQRVHYVSD